MNKHNLVGDEETESPAASKEGRTLTLDDARNMPTMPIPDAGRIFLGLSRNASYDAARQGVIKTIQVGGLKRAITKPLAEMCGVKVNF